MNCKRYQRRARKERFCDYCGREICAGQEYIRYVYVNTVDFGADQDVHIHCDALWTAFVKQHPEAVESKHPFDDLKQWVWDTYCVPNCIGGKKCSAWRCEKVLRGLLPENVVNAAVVSAAGGENGEQ